jgi:hypothetical protein
MVAASPTMSSARCLLLEATCASLQHEIGQEFLSKEPVVQDEELDAAYEEPDVVFEEPDGEAVTSWKHPAPPIGLEASGLPVPCPMNSCGYSFPTYYVAVQHFYLWKYAGSQCAVSSMEREQNGGKWPCPWPGCDRIVGRKQL